MKLPKFQSCRKFDCFFLHTQVPKFQVNIKKCLFYSPAKFVQNPDKLLRWSFSQKPIFAKSSILNVWLVFKYASLYVLQLFVSGKDRSLGKCRRYFDNHNSKTNFWNSLENKVNMKNIFFLLKLSLLSFRTSHFFFLFIHFLYDTIYYVPVRREVKVQTKFYFLSIIFTKTYSHFLFYSASTIFRILKCIVTSFFWCMMNIL